MKRTAWPSPTPRPRAHAIAFSSTSTLTTWAARPASSHAVSPIPPYRSHTVQPRRSPSCSTAQRRGNAPISGLTRSHASAGSPGSAARPSPHRREPCGHPFGARPPPHLGAGGFLRLAPPYAHRLAEVGVRPADLPDAAQAVAHEGALPGELGAVGELLQWATAAVVVLVV